MFLPPHGEKKSPVGEGSGEQHQTPSRKQPQSAVPPSSYRSKYRSTGGPVRTTPIGRYDSKSRTLQPTDMSP
ncbi:hypothetical protein B296_00040602 [Ensete ventricosum]|uniref:Uncharacterized protein n=1 Tax=Ensete ventricosum TaxID=4639 RepID=A0A426ZI68_ENSVE|nr:hypothetical protein B296_00040602 [Ensete ventricosum]